MKTCSFLFITLSILFSSFSFSQNTFPASGTVGIGTTSPNGSSLLDVSSTTKGVLLPRMTKAQRDGIVSPATGLLIYQTNNTAGFYYFTGTSWQPVSVNGASQALDNLTAPTAVNIELLPGIDNTFDIGSTANSWKDVSLDGSVRFGDGSAQNSAHSNFVTGTGISITGTILSNSAPDQTITLTGAGGTTATGSYPNFTLATPSAYTTVSGLNISGTVISNTGDLNGLDDANNSLSNLAATSINQPMLPISDNFQDDGSLAKSWRDKYADGKVYLDGVVFLDNQGDQNTWVGNIANTVNTGTSNTVTGDLALHNNTLGSSNTANGASTLFTNTANDNTACGASALFSNTSGNENVAMGFKSLVSNTTGYNNTSVGSKTMNSNTTENNNTAMGGSTMFYSTSSFNTLTGASSFPNTKDSSAGYNTAIGYNPLEKNAGGYGNTASGSSALLLNENGYYSTATGMSALCMSTKYYTNILDAANCVADGHHSLDTFYHGSCMTAVGCDALSNIPYGDNTVAIGYAAGADDNWNESEMTFFGSGSDDLNFCCNEESSAIGYLSRIVDHPYVPTVRIGNSSVSSIGGYVSWTTVSDGRYKKKVTENVPGLSFINKLRPVTYHLDVTGLRTALGEDVSNGNEDPISGKAAPDEETKQSIDAKEKMLFTGFIAQEVEKAATDEGYDFDGVDKPGREGGLYGLRYEEFVGSLVKAAQELSEGNDDLEAKLLKMKKVNEDLHSELEVVKAAMARMDGYSR